MRAWLSLIGGIGLCGLAIWRLQRVIDHDPLSAAWHVEHDRRLWREGLDQACIDWPIRKITNEAGRFNAARLRKRA